MSGPSVSSFSESLRRYQTRVEQALNRYLPRATVPRRLHEAMRYATLNGGKRIRACLVYATGEALGVEDGRLDVPACAVELIHSYSLVHDDLPSMDNDDLRRGKPTCHRVYGESTALLVGDALQTLAFQILAEDATLAPQCRLQMIAQLARASGSQGMAGGQAIDLESVAKSLPLSELEDMHRRKTGALICASVLLGALSRADTEPQVLENLTTYARCIGLAFQIMDDVLDVEGDIKTLGKASGADQARGKPTYPALLGLTQAKAKAAELRTMALASLGSLGDNGGTLAHIADYIINRTH